MGDNQFIQMLYAHGIKFIIKGDIFRNRIAFLYFETHFIVAVYFIVTNHYSLDIAYNFFYGGFECDQMTDLKLQLAVKETANSLIYVFSV